MPNDKYARWYDQLVERARTRIIADGYKECHHVLPRALGGGDGTENLVDLTYREHFLAHWLLTKIYDGAAGSAMIVALHAMTLPFGERRVGSWRIELAKRALHRQVLLRTAEFRSRYEKKRRRAIRSIQQARTMIEQTAPMLTVKADRETLRLMTSAWLKGENNYIRRRYRRPWKPQLPKQKAI